MLSLSAKLEAALFASPEPLTAKQLASACGATLSQTEHALKHLGQELASRGLVLQNTAGSWQLATHPKAATVIANLYPERHKPVDLSKAALETLAVIVFQGPVSQAEIERVRGIASDQSLRSLLGRGLIQEVVRPGAPTHYGATHELLGQLGVSHTGEIGENRHAD